MTNTQEKRAGRPRTHASDRHRAAAYMRRVAGEGMVRVSVLVPAGRAGDFRAIAAAMRSASKRNRGAAGEHRGARGAKAWDDVSDAAAVRLWRDGGTADELTEALGYPVEAIAKRLVELDEAGTVRDVLTEFESRARAGALPLRR